MQLESETYGNVLVLTPIDARLDATCAQTFRDAANELFGPEHRVCAIDLQNVTFMDSMGLSALIGILNTIGRSRRLEICGVTPMVKKILRTTRMDSVLNVQENLEAVLSRNPGNLRSAIL